MPEHIEAEKDYWEEVIGEAFESAGMLATPDQIKSVADDVRVSHECYGMAFGLDVATVNLRAAQDREKRDLEKQLADEQSKVTCRRCKGTGSLTTYGGTFQSTSQCWKCSGQGRHSP